MTYWYFYFFEKLFETLKSLQSSTECLPLMKKKIVYTMKVLIII